MLPELLEQLASDTFGRSLPRSLPEVTLVVTIVTLLVTRIPRALRAIDPFWIALAGVTVATGLVLGEGRGGLAAIERTELYTGMLVHDGVGVFSRTLLLLFTVLLVVLSKITGLASRDDGQDYFVLVLGAVIGMCLMCRANHLMTVFLSVEMASVPSYVLAGIVKGRRRSGEAALKYSVYGAAAAGVMLYGISLLAGLLGTAHLPTLGQRLAQIDVATLEPSQQGVVAALALAGTLLLIGMAFKLSAAPFHFWAPDVFAGAPAEVGAFLSVASKTAALVLLVRLVATTLPYDAVVAEAEVPVAAQLASASEPTSVSPVGSPRSFVATLLAVAAALTCTLGNLAALAQQNAKRLLAYSTIAHAGYLLMPIAAAVVLAGHDPAAASSAAAAVLLYATGYLFMNTTAFAAVALVRNTRGTETLDDYAGLAQTAPVTAGALCLAMIGLLGLPPMIGFFGKLAALRSVAEAGGWWMNLLLIVAVVNTAISLVYYLRVMRIVSLDPPAAGAAADRPLPAGRVFLAVGAAPIVLLGLAPEWLTRLATVACEGLFG